MKSVTIARRTRRTLDRAGLVAHHPGEVARVELVQPLVVRDRDRPGRAAVSETAASMPNFAASPSVWNVTASGVTISTGLPVWRRTFSAHTSCIGVLPRPQSANSAARPWRIAHPVRSAWNGNRKSGIHSGSNPAAPSSWARRSRSARYSAVLTVPAAGCTPPPTPG